MGNMSYCRFENTASDFNDCYEAIIEYEYNNRELNMYERDGLRALLALSKQFIQIEEQIEEIINYKEEE